MTFTSSQDKAATTGEIEGFHTLVEKICKHMRETVSYFADELEESFSKREWVFVDDVDLQCPDQTVLKIDSESSPAKANLKSAFSDSDLIPNPSPPKRKSSFMKWSDT